MDLLHCCLNVYDHDTTAGELWCDFCELHVTANPNLTVFGGILIKIYFIHLQYTFTGKITHYKNYNTNYYYI